MSKMNKGFTLVELLVVIAILGILMGALVPNIMGAIAKSQMTAMEANGKKIAEALIAESAEGDDLWPRGTKDASQDQDDDEIYRQQTSATEYFKLLFDINNQKETKWRPYIDGKLLESLWGNGVTPAKPGNLEKQNVAWCIVAGASGIDNIPALITRNIDVKSGSFLTSGQQDYSSNKDELTFSSTYPQPFGEKGCVIIMKDGSAKKLEARKCTYREVYNRRTISLPDSVQLEYLEP